jgi:hypothetical protein
LQWLFGCLSLALVVYGTTLAQAVKAGVWFRRRGAAGEAAGQASAGGCGPRTRPEQEAWNSLWAGQAPQRHELLM